MDRSGVMEIRKLFTKYVEGESAAGNLAGCLITLEKEIRGEFCEKLLVKEERMIRKLYGIFRRVLPNNHTEIIFTSEDKQRDGIQFLLDKVCGTNLENPELLHILYEKIAEGLPEDTAHLVLILHYTYSIPIRTSDRQKLDGESEEDYPFIVAAVCPLKTETGTLDFDEEEGTLKENLPLRKLENPGFGFLFPSFTDRSADKDQTMCFRTEKLDIAQALFGQTLPKPEKPVRRTAAAAVPEQAMAIQMENREASGEPPKGNAVPVENLLPDYLTAPAQTLETDTVPSLDTGTTNTLAPPIRPAEEPEKHPSSRDTEEDEPITGELMAGQIEPAEPKRAPKPVRISGDRRRVIRRVIDGQEYFLVPVEEAMLE